MLVSLSVSYKTFFIFNSRGTGISDVIYTLLNIMGWTMCSKNFERLKFQFRCLLCFSRDYFFTFSFESTNLYQEQQIMDLSASDIKLRKFGIRSQTV